VDKTAAFFEMGLIRLQVAAALLPLSEHLGVFARHLFNERRLRDRAFDARLFGEPSWDILLDLFASEAEGKPVSATSAALAGSVPVSSGLRSITRLEESGLVAREPGQHRRSVNVRLTEMGRGRMAAILSDMLSNHVRATAVHNQ
jgi:DNA-binding MarR family transcriptional regulator